MAGELQGQVAIVTGGGRGIGRAIALRYAEAGAAVTVTARSAGQLEETASLIRAAGGKVLAIPGDVSAPASVRDVCARTEQELGPVTVVMNNAGITGPYGPVWLVDPEYWWQTLEVHLRGAFLYTHELVPSMIERGGGRVINMVSGAGVRPNPNFSGYGVAKTAMIRLSETLALEGKDHGIMSFAMSPGLVYTELAESTINDPGAQRWRPEFVARLIEDREHGDLEGKMALVTTLAVQLASGAADPLTGRHFNPGDDVDAMVKEAAAR